MWQSIDMDDFEGKGRPHLQRLSHGGNSAFRDYLAQLKGLPDFKTLPEKYLHPQVLYYREILDARVGKRSVEPFEVGKWLALASSSVSASDAGKTSKSEVDWHPDSAQCMLCSSVFTPFVRRHHCRRCGKCVCARCAPSGNTRPILEWSMPEPVRHCKNCFRSPLVKWA